MTVSIAKRPARDSTRLRAQVAALAPWFQNLHLGEGIWTAPDHFLGDYPSFKYRRFEHALPHDLTGRTVLDIGCNAGFFAIEMKRRGADLVFGIDTDDRYLAQARLAASALGHDDIEFKRMSVYDVAKLRQKFDLVLFMGVLYHLRHPLLALDLIREHVAGDLLLFQTMQQGSKDIMPVPEDHPYQMPGTREDPEYFNDPSYPKLHFVEREFAHDWSNWWVPNRACSEAILRAAGFRIEARPEAEVYLCRVTDIPYSDYSDEPMAAYPAQRLP